MPGRPTAWVWSTKWSPRADLATRGRQLLDRLLAGGPQAQSQAKDLVATVAEAPLDEALVAETAARIARIRVSPEGREGIQAFLDKRKPGWTRD